MSERPPEIEELEHAYKQAARAYTRAASKFGPDGDRLITEIRDMLARLDKLLREYEDGQVD